MNWRRGWLILAICAGLRAGSGVAATPTPLIELPLQVHLVQGIALSRGGETMTVWITPAEIENTVLPEINRIWQPAGIAWRLAGVHQTALGTAATRRDLETFVLSIDHEPRELRPQGAATLRAVAREAGARTEDFHIVVLPYMGRTLQGWAMPRFRVSYLGAWTDKPSQGREPPRRVKLQEPEPLFIGSFARTAAHELGHLLGLKHDGCTSRCLMGGRTQGYLLSAREIETARGTAEKFLAR